MNYRLFTYVINYSQLLCRRPHVLCALVNKLICKLTCPLRLQQR